MRILYLTHPEHDYGATFLYMGLCDVLGAECVYDYPYKPSYHGQAHEYTCPRTGDVHTMFPLSWMHPRGSAYANPAGASDIVRDKIRDGTIELVVVESLRIEAMKAYEDLRSDIRKAGIPVVLHDGLDDERLLRDEFDTWYQASDYNLILKREMRKDVYQSHHVLYEGRMVLGFPFSCPAPAVDTMHTKDDAVAFRQLNFSFIMRDTHPYRRAVRDALMDYKHYAHLCLIPAGEVPSSWSDYIDITKNSTIGISVRGNGYDTVRFWELPLCAVMLADCPPLHYENELIPGKHYLPYRSPEECYTVLNAMHGRAEDLQKIFEEGAEFVREHHTNKARAQYLLNKLHEFSLLS